MPETKTLDLTEQQVDFLAAAITTISSAVNGDTVEFVYRMRLVRAALSALGDKGWRDLIDSIEKIYTVPTDG
jgi:hypothetical protein